MSEKKLKLTFIADTHYYSQTLGISGRAYELRSDSDQKCLAETGAIIDAAFKKIADSDTDAVLIAGDLTNNGETVCHEEFRQKLCALQKSKPVYVITATHDWCCDKNPRRFEGNCVFHDVPTMPHEKLRDFYFEFGPKQAVSEFITHLGTSSYAVDLTDKVRLLALNDDQNGRGGAGFSEEHFQWIEAQLRDAGEKGMSVISMQHHLLLVHLHKMITGGGTSVMDNEAVAARLADAGLRYSFVGHSHMLDVAKFTSPAGNTLSEVNIGSLCGYPAPLVNVTVNDNSLSVDVDYLEKFDYNGERNANEYLKNHALCLINKVLEAAAYGDRREFIDRFTALQANGEKAAKFRFLIKPAARWLLNADVMCAYRLGNLLTLGRVLDKKNALALKDKKVIEFVEEILLNVFDGGSTRRAPDSDYYRLVHAVASIPSFYARSNRVCRQLPEVIHALVAGNELNSFPIEL